MVFGKAATVPKDAPPVLKRRDTSKLPKTAIVRFQQISLAKTIANNYRWVLLENGDWFFAPNSGKDTPASGDPFDTSMPEKPTKTLAGPRWLPCATARGGRLRRRPRLPGPAH